MSRTKDRKYICEFLYNEIKHLHSVAEEMKFYEDHEADSYTHIVDILKRMCKVTEGEEGIDIIDLHEFAKKLKGIEKEDRERDAMRKGCKSKMIQMHFEHFENLKALDKGGETTRVTPEELYEVSPDQYVTVGNAKQKLEEMAGCDLNGCIEKDGDGYEIDLVRFNEYKRKE